MTARSAAKCLGIGNTTLLRLEGSVYPPVARFGPKRIRVYRQHDIAKVHTWLEARRRGEALSATSLSGDTRARRRERQAVGPDPALVRLRAAGALTSTEAARKLGISKASLFKLEGAVFEKLPRYGPHRLRLFGDEQLARVRDWIAARSRGEASSACAIGQGHPVWLTSLQRPVWRNDVQGIRARGCLTTTEVARMVGIGVTTLRALEGSAFSPVPRVGKLGLRAFRPKDLQVLRAWLVRRAEERARAQEVGLRRRPW